MKKISYFLILIMTLSYLSACSGYRSIFDSSSLNFKIVDYDVSGEKKLGEQIYFRLNNLSKAKEKNSRIKNVYIFINVNKNKNPTSKNSAGKILAYKISISTKISVKDLTTGNEILNKKFVSSSFYEVQDKYSETLKLERKSIEDMLNKTYQDLLVSLLENM
jgi:hypothetical protein